MHSHRNQTGDGGRAPRSLLRAGATPPGRPPHSPTTPCPCHFSGQPPPLPALASEFARLVGYVWPLCLSITASPGVRLGPFLGSVFRRRPSHLCSVARVVTSAHALGGEGACAQDVGRKIPATGSALGLSLSPRAHDSPAWTPRQSLCLPSALTSSLEFLSSAAVLCVVTSVTALSWHLTSP